eukprot:363607-Chlamydomonas_euryale.AAC.8
MQACRTVLSQMHLATAWQQHAHAMLKGGKHPERRTCNLTHPCIIDRKDCPRRYNAARMATMRALTGEKETYTS